jgi:hypothetical protein
VISFVRSGLNTLRITRWPHLVVDTFGHLKAHHLMGRSPVVKEFREHSSSKTSSSTGVQVSGESVEIRRATRIRRENSAVLTRAPMRVAGASSEALFVLARQLSGHRQQRHCRRLLVERHTSVNLRGFAPGTCAHALRRYAA